MLSIKKILLFLMGIFILFLLLQVSFMGKNIDSLNKIPEFEVKNGEYKFDIIGEKIELSPSESSSGIDIVYLNPLDEVLHLGDVDIPNNTNIINLGKGIYVVNIDDINSKYTINGNGFQIKNNGPASIYIDTSLNTNNTILSLNSTIELNLINDDSTIANTSYIYPHMYIRFTPSQIKNVKDADLLKLTQWFPMNYFPEGVMYLENINPNFINLFGGDNGDTIKKMFSFLNISLSNNEKFLESFKPENFGSIVGENLIKGYSKIFLNDTKKIVYLKNTILRGMGELIYSGENMDSQIDFTIQTLQEIKDLSEKDYLEMKNIIDYIGSAVLESNSTSQKAKLNISTLYNTARDNEFDFDSYYLLELNNIYSKLDYNLSYSYNNIYKDLGKISDSIISSNNGEKEKSYTVLYLNYILINAFSKKVDMSLIIPIFEDYSNTSLGYYSNSNDIRTRTGIAEYSKVIENLLASMREYFFEKDRDENGLLVPNDDTATTTTEINILENNINKIFTYYDNYKDKLWEKEISLYSTSFENSEKLSKEYFSAIKNYEEYTTSELEKNLLYGSNTSSDFDVLTRDKAMAYLRGFNSLNLSNTTIYLRGYNYCILGDADIELLPNEIAYCYKIQNVILEPNQKKIDFTLIPGDYNNMTNINIDGEVYRGSYKLDQRKVDLEELRRQYGALGDTSQYLFENFFLNTFIEQDTWGLLDNTQDNNNNDNSNSGEDSPTIRAYKSRLLSKGGELNDLPFITIGYNNINVSELNGAFNIHIDDTMIYYSNDNNDFSGKFWANYLPSPKSSFENIEMLITDAQNNPYLLGNKIKINGEYRTDNMEAFNNLFTYILSLNRIIHDLSDIYGISNFDITCTNLSNNYYEVKTNSLKIIIDDQTIKSIVYDGEELLEENIFIDMLKDTLKLTP